MWREYCTHLNTEAEMGTQLCGVSADLETWSKHEWTDGLQIDALRELDTLSVRTMNNIYDIIVLHPRTAEVLVRGGKFFPEYTTALLAGSSLGGSFLKLHGIYPGFRMEFHRDRMAIVTSDVQSIKIVAEESDSHLRTEATTERKSQSIAPR